MNNEQNHILYIDDEIENLHSFKIVFKLRYNVHIASNSQQAMDILYTEQIKVVLVDQQMPDITGLELCKVIHKTYDNILCIIVTAHSNQNVMQEAINQGGIFQFITKPWDKDALKQVIDNALDKYHLVEENKHLISDLSKKNQELLEKNEVLTITAELIKENQNELLRYNKELLKAKEKAEESDRLKTAFLANISHEIRTPLNGILGFIELLTRNERDHLSVKSQGYFDIIKQSSNQLLSIINDLIDISKVEADAILIKENEFLIDELIQTIKTYYIPRFIKKQIEFRVNNHLNGEKMCTDKHKLLKVLNHLIDNGLKYTNAGSVTLSTKKIDNSIQFIICDTGIGIDEKDSDKIWSKFTQLNLGSSTLNLGNGIGLTIAKSFTEILGGSIALKSAKDVGCEFTVRIPRDIKQIIS